jgi:hypothetical protein
VKTRTAIAFLILLLGVVSEAPATTHNLSAIINQAQEVPPSGSGGTGSATVTYDDVSHALTWNISWSGLSGPATLMHFHGPAPVGANAGVQVNIGLISGLTSPSIGNTIITAAQGTDLLNGLWYINIHTGQFPGGEIRGQVLTGSVAVEEATWSGVKALYDEK